MTTVMAKKPEKPAEEQPFSKQVAFRIVERDVWEAVEEVIGEQKYPITFTDVMLAALRAYLKSEGKLPRPRRKPPA